MYEQKPFKRRDQSSRNYRFSKYVINKTDFCTKTFSLQCTRQQPHERNDSF